MYDLCLFCLTNDKSFRTWLRWGCQYQKISRKNSQRRRFNDLNKSFDLTRCLISINQKNYTLKLITFGERNTVLMIHKMSSDLFISSLFMNETEKYTANVLDAMFQSPKHSPNLKHWTPKQNS